MNPHTRAGNSKTAGKSRRVLRALVLAGLVAAISWPASAQTTRSLDPGTRVRIRLDRQVQRFVGLVADLKPDTILVAAPDPDFEKWRPVPVSEIAELEISGGRRRLTLLGVGIGIVAGTVATAAYNSIVQSQCYLECPVRTSTVVGGALGGFIGGFSFYFVRPERWHRIVVPDRNDSQR